MDWTLPAVRAAGFAGFVPFADLPAASVPDGPGVYLVLRDGGVDTVRFRSENPAGRHRGRNPTVDVSRLVNSWVADTSVLYIGKAGPGADGRRGLRKRLDEYRRHGAGEPVGHWGGRFVWQLEDSDRLLVAWRHTPGLDAELLEGELIAEFRSRYGVLPFANLKSGRAPLPGAARLPQPRVR